MSEHPFICDMCGFRYSSDHKRKSSYGTIQCRVCFDGAYDLKNHPQNFPYPGPFDDPKMVEDPRPEAPTEVPVTIVWSVETSSLVTIPDVWYPRKSIYIGESS